MENRKITCDFCNRDLTYTGNSCGWKIRVINSGIPINPECNIVTDMYIPPRLDRDLDFCDLYCLKGWISKK